MKILTSLLSKRSSAPSLLTLLAATACSLHHAEAGQQIQSASGEKTVTPAAEPVKDGGLYVAVFGGIDFAQSSDEKKLLVPDARPQPAGTPAEIAAIRAAPNDIPPTAVLIPNGASNPTPTFSSDVNGSNTGWLAGLKFGYVIPSTHRLKLGLEFEAFYNGVKNTHASFKSDKALNGIRTSDREGDESGEPFTNPDSTVPRTKLTADANDDVNAAVFMWNGYLRFDLGRVRPYLGGGLGLAYVTHDYSYTPTPGVPAPSGAVAPLETQFVGNPLYDGGAVARLPLNHSKQQIEHSPAGYVRFKDDSEVTFAYQALGGVDVVLTPRLSVFAEYKALFYYDGPYYRNLLNQEVTLGVRFGL